MTYLTVHEPVPAWKVPLQAVVLYLLTSRVETGGGPVHVAASTVRNAEDANRSTAIAAINLAGGSMMIFQKRDCGDLFNSP